MIRLGLFVLVVIGVSLYFSGALQMDNTDESVSVTVDKNKAKELAESIKEKIEE